MLRSHDPREPHEARDPVAVTETGASPLDRESRSGGPVPAFRPNRTRQTELQSLPVPQNRGKFTRCVVVLSGFAIPK